MCFDPVTLTVMAVTALSSVVASGLANKSANNAAAANYNNQSEQAEMMNRQAIAQQQETDARNRLETRRQGESATANAASLVLENRKRMATARASAGTSGLMGLPLNMIDQNYNALIGGVGTNLSTQLGQLDENNFFNALSSKLTAQNVTNGSIPQQPYMQPGLGGADYLNAGIKGLSAGIGGGSFKMPSFGTKSPALPFGPSYTPNGPLGA